LKDRIADAIEAAALTAACNRKLEHKLAEIRSRKTGDRASR